MNIIQWNDLHIDVHNFDITNFEEEDLELFSQSTLVLAGDLTSNWQNLMLTFLEEVSKLFKYVVYVFGNHEYWYSDIMADLDAGRKIRTMQRAGLFPTNVHLLDNRCVELEGVTFIGGTLWTDLNKGNPIDRIFSESGMRDYDVIKVYDGERQMFSTKLWETLHEQTLLFFKTVLSNLPDTSKAVIVSHHAPSALSIHPRYEGHGCNSSYYSDLSDFLLTYSEKFTEGWNWMHGHVHSQFDYTIGTCRVTCNPRGYQSKYLGGEDTGFDYKKIVEV